MIAALVCAALAVGPVCAPGCAPHATPERARSLAATRVDTLIDTVFVVSNRRRTATGFAREATDSLWYGLYVTQNVTGPDSVRALASMHVARIDSLALDAVAWRARLAEAARDTAARRASLVFVHGYSSSPGRAVSQGVQVRARGAHRGPLVVFLWPTHDRFVAMPTPTRAYKDDARAAALSGPALARVLRAIDSVAPGAVVVAHSMGSRVALDAMVGDTGAFAALMRRPLRALGIFSPDIGADRFRSAFAPQLPALARRVALYGASTDYLLGVAVLGNRERRASGITRRGAPLPGIELIDDTRGARAEPLLVALLGPRHAVRWAGAAVADFFGIVVAGADPSCRVTAGAADSVSEGRWRLRKDAVLSSWLGGGCLPRQ
jgi:esterase/lipase superfamily enzyme